MNDFGLPEVYQPKSILFLRNLLTVVKKLLFLPPILKTIKH